GPWATRAEQLSEARVGLSEGGAGQIGRVAREIGGIVQVEQLADRHQTPSLVNRECTGQPQIESLNPVVERIARGQRDSGNDAAMCIGRHRVGLVELAHQASQVGLAKTTIELAQDSAGEQVACSAVAVEVD